MQVKVAEFVEIIIFTAGYRMCIQESQNLWIMLLSEVYNWTADCQDNKIIEYKANIK